MLRLLIAMVPVLLLCSPGAAAQDVEALERQLEQARDAAPMVVKPFTASTRKAKYFGDYEPRKGNEFKRGEEIVFYGELKNLTFKKNAQGVFEPAFEVDLEVKALKDGKTMSQPKVMNFKLPTRSRVQDLFLNLSLSLDQAPPGNYNVKFVIRDLNSKKSAVASQDITLK
ncbi:MAG TPA: hypothetical protein VFD95_10560 [Usitatibacter sp.]|jgi:hypothetical protein|nr:hypothetical protein [Usitatibacter sp.]